MSLCCAGTSRKRGKKIRDQGFHVLEGDGTREESLMRANVKNAGSLLAVMDSDPENLFAVLTARDLNPTLHITARAEDPGSEPRMLRAGADSIISPFTAAGKRVAEKLMKNANIFEPGAIDEEQRVSTINWRSVVEGDNICGLSVSKVYDSLGQRVVGLRRKGLDLLQPSPDHVVMTGDELMLLGGSLSVVGEPAIRKRICIVDDNPVIVRLYTRLFQKAGLLVTAAVTGRDGINLVNEEEPDALVVDYHLPDMTGVKLCGVLRKGTKVSDMKIFPFTADGQEKIKVQASSVGIDKVVIKSADAGENVSLVSSELL